MSSAGAKRTAASSFVLSKTNRCIRFSSWVRRPTTPDGRFVSTFFKTFAHFRHDEDEQHVVVAAAYLMDVFDVVIASQVLVGVRKLGAEKTDNP